MKKIFQLCVQGDVNDTYEYLKGLENKSNEQAKMVEQYNNRFYKENPDYKISHKDLWIEDVLNIYRSYFVDVLTNKENRSIAEVNLMEKLNSHLTVDAKGTDMKSTEESIKSIFQKKALTFLVVRLHHIMVLLSGKRRKIKRITLIFLILQNKFKCTFWMIF